MTPIDNVIDFPQAHKVSETLCWKWGRPTDIPLKELEGPYFETGEILKEPKWTE